MSQSSDMQRVVTVAIAVAGCWFGSGAHACPVGTKITVDNDIPGSGYSEEKPENWIGHNVDACAGTYRYLSHTVGDGTRTGKAIWKPAIVVAGTYEVVTGFRATVNRTDDADYVLHDDLGGTKKKSVNQKYEGGCVKETIGNVYCAVGGNCRLVLDGTDDNQSDAADVTTFTLVSCDGTDAGAPSPCAAIAATPGWEVCAETATSCAGTYSDGAGCTVYCAAAGMQCVQRFGGEPGCSKEAQTPIPCGADNGHASDYCECSLPAGSGGAGGSAGTAGRAGAAGAAGAVGGAAGTGAAGGSGGSGNATTADAGAGAPRGSALPGDESGCACRSGALTNGPIGVHAAALLLAALWWRRRRDARAG